jgi:DNA-directed RNA polymerase specialized sigma24 family protein
VHTRQTVTSEPAADPEQIVVAPLLEERLETTLLRLPTDYRKTILLRDVE